MWKKVHSINVMWLCLLLLVHKVTPQTDGEGCFVNGAAINSTSSSCGPESRPCKTLNQCVHNKKLYGKIFMLGDHEVGENIEVRKGLTIIGVNNASIKPKDAFVRSIKFIGVSVMMMNIRFENLVILIQRGKSTTVESCVFQRSHLRVERVVNSLVTKCAFRQSLPRGALFLFDMQLSVIRDSLFVESRSSHPGWGGAVCLRKTRQSMIENSSFVGNRAKRVGGALYAGNVLNNTIKDCKFLNNSARKGGAIYFRTYPRKFIAVTIITRCIFMKNRAVIEATDPTVVNRPKASPDGGAIYGFGSHSKTISIWIVKCHFLKNEAHDGRVRSSKGGAIWIHIADNIIKECSFRKNNAVVGGALHVFREGNSRVKVLSTRFHDNEARTGGAVSIYRQMFPHIPPDRELEIMESNFVNNNATFGGALYIAFKNVDKVSNRSNTVTNCRFFNNSATSIGQSIYSNEQIRLNNTYVQSFEKSNAYHIHVTTGVRYSFIDNITIDLFRNKGSQVGSKSSGLYMSASSIVVLTALRLKCPRGFNIDETILSYPPKKDGRIYSTLIAVDCLSCSPNFYNLRSGTLHIGETYRKSIKPDIMNYNCSKCEIGGVCDIDVKAVDNFWGYRHSQSQVSFKICPQRYCCSVDTVPCDSYNTCAAGRSGTLCGECDKGYKQSFITDGCIPIGEVECDLEIFVIYIVIFTFVHTIVFVCVTNVKDIIAGLKAIVKSKEHREQVEQGRDEESGFSIAAFVQIVVLHIQIGSLLKVKFVDGSYTENSNSNSSIVDSLTDVFNFRFSIYQQVCPTDDLTLPTKELILFGMKMASFVYLIVLGILFKGVNILWRKGFQRRSTLDEETVDEEMDLSIIAEYPAKTVDDVFSKVEEALSTMQEDGFSDSASYTNHHLQGKLTLIHRLQITFIKLIKMFYTPITKAALQMIHCVEILGTYHLFVYGSHVCFSWWQIWILVVIIPGILLFPVSFEMALRMLKKKMVSPAGFTVAMACPYCAILMYLWNAKQGREGEDTTIVSPADQMFADTVLAAEQDLFVEDNGSLGWQIIQLYRTFVINVLTIFLINPLYRSIAFGVVLFGFVTHDRYRQPYKNKLLNNIQSLSSRCLLLIMLCNIIPSVSFMVNVTSVPSVKVVVKLLSILELVLYAVVPLSLPVWKIWEKVTEKKEEKTIPVTRKHQ